jgi:hypothetical protein
MPQDKVWDDAKPLEQKFPGALLELWKMQEANDKVRREKARENDPPHWLQSKGGAPAGYKPTEIGNRVRNFFPSFHRFTLDRLLKEEPIRHAEFVEAAGRPKLNAAQIKMLQEFDPEGDGYDYDTAKAHGMSPDERGKWGSRSPVTGQLLKGRKHKSWKETLEGEAAEGYTIYKDPASGKYYSTPQHAKGPTRANIFTGLSGLAQEMQNR